MQAYPLLLHALHLRTLPAFLVPADLVAVVFFTPPATFLPAAGLAVAAAAFLPVLALPADAVAAAAFLPVLAPAFLPVLAPAFLPVLPPVFFLPVLPAALGVLAGTAATAGAGSAAVAGSAGAGAGCRRRGAEEGKDQRCGP